MFKKTLSSILEKNNPKLKKSIKDVYKLKYDVGVLDLENIFLNYFEEKEILKLAKKLYKNKDITFDIGYKYFRYIKLKIKKGVFVPQYDTEQIIDIIKNKINFGDALEIGSGTGAISISLASETNIKIDSIDINKKAIKLAKQNDKFKKVNFINKDFFKFNPTKKYNLIFSNPPYIAKADPYVEDWVKKNQPKNSLYAKNNGLLFYEFLFNKIDEFLFYEGYIVLEIGFNQSADIIKLASKISHELEVVKDYSNHDRFVVIKYYGKQNN
ncbi:MAG: release factor glutamine methyltransferase [Candidatus Tyloplasma litorale]|nr:MAG: release factor glutamine methyltransferase [Mycoplasmatales bacterium]